MLSPDLWALTEQRTGLDADELAGAVLQQAEKTPHDFRTRLLIRDSLLGLCEYWGKDRFDEWISRSSKAEILREILASNLGAAGFPSLSRRIMNVIKPQTVESFLRELGLHVRRRTSLAIGGSISLILGNAISRSTEDIDVVDELPPELRMQPELLDQLAGRYGLRLAQFQSDNLPYGWETRLRSFGLFGQLEVHLVDVYDVFLSKLFSHREKDRDDLRVMLPHLDRQKIVDRLRTTATSLRREAALFPAAQKNWYILFGEDLPG